MGKFKKGRKKGGSTQSGTAQTQASTTTAAKRLFGVGREATQQSFVKLRDELINEFQRDYSGSEYVITALKTLQDQLPKLLTEKPEVKRIPIPSDANEDLKQQLEFENKTEYDIWKKDIYDWKDKVKEYKLIWNQVYSDLWAHCDHNMQETISGRTDYNDKVLNNPVELLKAIRYHTAGNKENKSEVLMLTQQLRFTYNIKQGNDESLMEYYKRFKLAVERLEDLNGGPMIHWALLDKDPYKDQLKKSVQSCAGRNYT